MNLFGNEPQEKAFGCVIHDTSSATSTIDYHIGKIEEWLRTNAKAFHEHGIKSSPIYVAVEYIKSANKEIKESIDAYYLKFKNDFKEQTP